MSERQPPAGVQEAMAMIAPPWQRLRQDALVQVVNYQEASYAIIDKTLAKARAATALAKATEAMKQVKALHVVERSALKPESARDAAVEMDLTADVDYQGHKLAAEALRLELEALDREIEGLRLQAQCALYRREIHVAALGALPR